MNTQLESGVVAIFMDWLYRRRLPNRENGDAAVRNVHDTMIVKNDLGRRRQDAVDLRR
jgi:hypothetical protein